MRPHNFTPGERTRIGLLARITRAQQFAEALWRELPWAALAALAFIAASLFGLWGAAPPWFRQAALLGVAGLAGLAFWRAVHAPRPEPWGRLEAANGLPAGRLRLLTDPNPELAPARKKVALQRRLRPSGWRLGWAGADRWGLGPLLLLLIAAGAFVAGKEGPGRIGAALSPYATPLEAIAVEAWILPPAYTGRPPEVVRLDAGRAAEIAPPRGSRLRLLVRGAPAAPRLEGPSAAVWPGPEEEGARLIEAPLDSAGRYRLRLGWFRVLADLTVRIAADGAPEVAFAEPPGATANLALRIAYKTRDDYGVAALWLALRRGDEVRVTALPAPPPGEPGRLASGVAYRDLTPDAWAGEVVELRLVAADGAGNHGVSGPVRLRLPERIFTHPMARRIAAVRKRIFAQPGLAPLWARQVSGLSEDLPAFEGDPVVFMTLRSAAWRLALNKNRESVISSTGPLWQAALALEAKMNPAGLDNLREQFERLMQSLRDGGPAEDQARALEQALSRFLNEAAARQGEPMQGGEAGGQSITPDQLAQMMQALKDRIAAGDMAGTQRIAQALQSILENLRTGGPAQAAQRQMQQDAQALQRLTQEQQRLAQQTGQSASPQSLEQRQAQLRGQAGQLRQRMQGAEGAAMDEAQGAMAQAGQAMRQGDGAAAMAAQAQALQALARAGQALSQRMQGADQGGLPAGSDPLGRAGPGFRGEEFKLPGEAERREIERIRAILEQRAADPSRSEEERAYIQRLLRRF